MQLTGTLALLRNSRPTSSAKPVAREREKERGEREREREKEREKEREQKSKNLNLILLLQVNHTLCKIVKSQTKIPF